MEWTKQYITGIDEIDLQHKELFDIIDRFKTSFSDPSKNNNREVGKILKFLVNYTMFHFTSEEDYMKRIHYMGFDAHKEIHDEFISELHGILRKLKAKGSYRPIELYYFLIKWLQEHIAKEDQKYVKAGGKIKTLKTTMNNKEDILHIITPNLSRIDLMLNDKLITEKERDQKRQVYLHAYYNSYKIDCLIDLHILLESSSLLSSKKIISLSEDKELKNYICNSVDLDRKLKLETNDETRDEMKNYLIHHGLYS